MPIDRANLIVAIVGLIIGICIADVLPYWGIPVGAITVFIGVGIGIAITGVIWLLHEWGVL